MAFDDREYLEHFGVKGMKWGVRKKPESTGSGRTSKTLTKVKKSVIKEAEGYLDFTEKKKKNRQDIIDSRKAFKGVKKSNNSKALKKEAIARSKQAKKNIKDAKSKYQNEKFISELRNDSSEVAYQGQKTYKRIMAEGAGTLALSLAAGSTLYAVGLKETGAIIGGYGVGASLGNTAANAINKKLGTTKVWKDLEKEYL